MITVYSVLHICDFKLFNLKIIVWNFINFHRKLFPIIIHKRHHFFLSNLLQSTDCKLTQRYLITWSLPHILDDNPMTESELDNSPPPYSARPPHWLRRLRHGASSSDGAIGGITTVGAAGTRYYLIAETAITRHPHHTRHHYTASHELRWNSLFSIVNIFNVL